MGKAKTKAPPKTAQAKFAEHVATIAGTGKWQTTTTERVSKVADGAVHRGADGRVVVQDSPCERMQARGVLSERQGRALQKYHHHWYNAGMSGGPKSMDFNAIFAGQKSRDGLPSSENACFHRERYRSASQQIGLEQSVVVEAVVCREEELSDAGRRLGWHNDPQARAAAITSLRMSADSLIRLWGL